MTASFKNDLPFLRSVFDMWRSTVTPEITSMDWNPLRHDDWTRSLVAITSKTKGSVLGLDKADGPLVLLQLSVEYKSSSDDATIKAATSKLIQRHQ